MINLGIQLFHLLDHGLVVLLLAILESLHRLGQLLSKVETRVSTPSSMVLSSDLASWNLARSLCSRDASMAANWPTDSSLVPFVIFQGSSCNQGSSLVVSGREAFARLDSVLVEASTGADLGCSLSAGVEACEISASPWAR